MMLEGVGAVLAGLGAACTGIVAVVSLVVAVRAKSDAAEARATSPLALFEGLRTQVQTLIDTHQEAVSRWQGEREGLERALRRERARADGAEFVGLELQGQVAEMRIELAAARTEVTQLNARVDAAFSSK